MNKSAYFFRKGWSIALYTIWSFCLWGRRLPPGEGEKIRFQHRFQKRIASRMINVLRAGFGEGTPQQVSDRRHKKRGSEFLWHRSILALSTFARFIHIMQIPFSLMCMNGFGCCNLPCRNDHRKLLCATKNYYVSVNIVSETILWFFICFLAKQHDHV